jgi:hypothetical protein
VQPISCLRCRREIEAGHKSVAVYMFAQTVGVKPRQKSGAQRICFCPQCAVSPAMGMPPEGALNLAAWDMIRDLVSAEPSLNEGMRRRGKACEAWSRFWAPATNQLLLPNRGLGTAGLDK